MRVCVIGKYPPIQGGVSMRTYRTAHALAARGHDVDVVTNAREVRPPFRMHMRAQDWARCEAQHGAGAVRVHWTDPVDTSQSYIPTASPFVTKLATIAAGVHAASPFDVIYSHYMEPYGIAGHLLAQMTGVPHVVRMAGSDAGRLWRHPQFEALYDHVLRSAEAVVLAGAVADRAVRRGVDAARVASGGPYVLPADELSPEGPVLDVARLRAEVDADPDMRELMWGELVPGMPRIGVYGKLGDNKGTFALLEALARLKREGVGIGLMALAHGRPEVERRFRDRVQELGLADRVLQLPFLPHWRVPEFLRGCLAVCCLEQDFPIGIHTPIIPFEVLLSGTCLVASREVIDKLPQWQRLVHGYSCVAVEDVNDIAELSSKLGAIALEPGPAAAVGARGRDYALERQQGVAFPDTLEGVLAAVARRRPPPQPASAQGHAEGPARFPLTRIAAEALTKSGRRQAGLGAGAIERLDAMGAEDALGIARQVLAALAATGGKADGRRRSMAEAVKVEIAVAEAEIDIEASGGAPRDPLYRLAGTSWAPEEGGLAGLRPLRAPHLRVLRFDCDVSRLRGVATRAGFPAALGKGPSYIVAFARDTGREPLLVDRYTARILELSDGARTARDIVARLEVEFGRVAALDHLAWIEQLLVSSLIGLMNADKV